MDTFKVCPYCEKERVHRAPGPAKGQAPASGVEGEGGSFRLAPQLSATHPPAPLDGSHPSLPEPRKNVSSAIKCRAGHLQATLSPDHSTHFTELRKHKVRVLPKYSRCVFPSGIFLFPLQWDWSPPWPAAPLVWGLHPTLPDPWGPQSLSYAPFPNSSTFPCMLVPSCHNLKELKLPQTHSPSGCHSLCPPLPRHTFSRVSRPLLLQPHVP